MYKSIFPFNYIDNHEIHSTIQGKKIKFTKFSKIKNPNEHILTEHLNDMMSQKEFDNPSAYYDYTKLNENFDQNIYNGSNILHMNINSLFYRFDDIHTLLSQLYVKFDIIGITETLSKTHGLRTTNINLQGY